VRTFIAVDIPEPLRQRVMDQVERLRRAAPTARWVAPDALHLTLAFLGEVADAQVPAISALVGEVAARHAPFELHCRGTGTFGPLERPRVLWMALTGDNASLHRLHADLEGRLRTLGFSPEFEVFEPHITLARARNPRGDADLEKCAALAPDADFGAWPVGAVGLFVSQNGPDGMRYTALARHPLKL